MAGRAQTPAAREASSPLRTLRPVKSFVTVTDQTIRAPKAEDWVFYRGNYQAWGWSALDEINRRNVRSLQLVWSRAMEPGVNQATPLVYNGVMYLGNPGDVIQAIDAATGDLMWEYRHPLPDTAGMRNQLGQRKRAVALYGDNVYTVTWDNHVLALDARTGAKVWETDRGGDLYVSNSSGPVVANGVVVAGSTCQYAGFGCYVTGHDARTGRELWRNTMIPRPGEPGDETWAGSPYESRWMTGVWGHLTYDPELDLVYYGSSGVGPASEAQRKMPGATMAGTNTRYAVRPKTGDVVWKHQVLPRDNWDQECTFEMMTMTTPVNPDPSVMLSVNPNLRRGPRKTLTGVPCKTGIAWSFDAATGEFLWARATNEQNVVARIDGNGLVTVNEDAVLKEIGKTYRVCPTYNGGRDWPYGAYNPRSNVMYVQLANLCIDSTARADRGPQPQFVYNTTNVGKLSTGKDNVGRIDAISVETGRTVWSWETRVSNYAPILVTGGGLVFNGSMDRYLRALDADKGTLLWQTRLASQTVGAPIAFAVNGRQFVAITAGGGPIAGTQVGVTPEADTASGANAVYVFALPR
ncbi:MAG: ATP-binding protein [Acidobacteria bacterium RIFCSPLOWO2_02_FULL_68_18]|nr:MAG: ATP-binding protein [Acidobacteria bacterium RIFCSPLOWO2_02_FULL_68_18]OFW48205.1 MAG: ATP-binding protein [Acidobacteria bacterium RIFCSPLOWO2_12_FULL_68_19]